LVFWLGLVVFQAVVRWGQDGRRVLLGWLAFSAAGVILALLALFGAILPNKLPILGDLAGRVPQLMAGWPGAEAGFQPNQVAGTLLWFLPAPAAVLFCRHGLARLTDSLIRWFSAVLLVAQIILLITFLLMQSRGAMIGAAVATLTLLLTKRRGRLVFLLILLLAIIGLSLVGGETVKTFLNVQFLQDATGPFEPDFRLKLWAAAWQATGDFAYTGMGLGLFRHFGPLLYPFPTRPADVGHAHNFFLHTGAEMGVLGLVALSGLWLATMMVLVRGLKEEGQWRPLLLAAGWSFIAFTIYGLTDAVALGSKPSVFLWFFLGLVVITQSRRSGGL
ncbi:MAG: O-antigen ligase family protein, partial [Chloroflexota bacterium]